MKQLSFISSKIINPLLMGVFIILISLLYCLVQYDISSATKITGWNAGNIMSDGVMSNKYTMTQSQIQNFLNKKNTCKTNPKNISVLDNYNDHYGYLWSNGTKFKYHLKNSKFICLADQDFDGESAARIIYRASQDYSINPQVLLVLLQKENGLITDNWPNYNFQYATATGYACPDSGPNNSANCNKNYFGFKNQIRHAAGMFRTLLNGQGTNNYPVGDNFILYNPSSSCGSGKVNVKNRATGALYTYTPYQPNSATLKRDWPMTEQSCGAYGNLNFYMYFKSWFGSTQHVFQKMQKPRYMISKKDQYKTYPLSGDTDSQLISKNQFIFFDQVVTINGIQYLRSSWDTARDILRAIPRDDLTEVTFKPMQTPRYMSLNQRQNKLYPVENRTDDQVLKRGEEVYFGYKATVNGEVYLQSNWDNKHGLDRAVPLTSLDELEYKPMQTPRYMKSMKKQNKIAPITNTVDEQVIDENQAVYFSEIVNINGIQYLRSKWDVEHNINRAIPRDNLEELEFTPMSTPRYITLRDEQAKTFPVTNTEDTDIVSGGQAVFFSESMFINNTQYLRSKWDVEHGIMRAFPRGELSELSYTNLDNPRALIITKKYAKLDPRTNIKDEQILTAGMQVHFSQVMNINGHEYYRSTWDMEHNIMRAFPLSRLAEVTP